MPRPARPRGRGARPSYVRRRGAGRSMGIGLAGDDLALLLLADRVQVVQGLVGRTEDFDRGDQTIFRAMTPANFDERFLVRVVLDGLDGDRNRFVKVDLLGNRDYPALRSRARWAAARMQVIHIGLDGPVRVLRPKRDVEIGRSKNSDDRRMRAPTRRVIRQSWRQGNQSGLSRYGSMPGTGEGISAAPVSCWECPSIFS